jgi:signal transduction histidine kinase
MSAKIVKADFKASKAPKVTKVKFSWSKIFDAARQEATGAKTSSYLATTAAVGLIYTLIGLTIIALTPTEYLIILWLFLSFFFAVSFSPLRYALEELIRQLFPDSDYDSHSLVKRLNTISYGSLTLNDLSSTFFQELTVSFNVPESAFIFLKGKTQKIIKTSDHFKNISSLTPAQMSTLLKHLPKDPKPLKTLKTHEATAILKGYHVKIIVPLTNNNTLVGILLLGTKFDQKHFTTKDLKVLEAIAPKIGFAIKNALSFEFVHRRNVKLIDELRLANDKLRHANRQLREDDKLKDEFVYIATHELKNPVTAMKGYLSLIDEGQFGPIPTKLQKPITVIHNSNQQLIELLNNLLQIARAEAQKVDINVKPVTICDVIDEVIKDLKPLIEQKNLNTIHSCANPSVTVMADKERLREIISNLVSNAVKYSDKGTIEITHEISQDRLITHVKDEGVGISSSDQKKLFTRFFRVEEEAAKGIPGTGLGLFICKQLIEKMHGRISYQTQLNHGSIFTIALPLARTYALKSSK